MTDATDWELVSRVKSGDTDAFAQIVSRYQKPVIHFCQRMLRSHQDAEDIAQECFVRFYRSVDRLEPRAKVSTMLFCIARNLAINHLRDSERRGRGITDSMDAPEAKQIGSTSSLNPAREAHLAELGALIERGLAAMTPEHREVLLLRELQGFDYDEIAEMAGCPLGTLKSRLARARNALRDFILANGGNLT
jgi:RNA polymerase sigma-70 factor (ECF subfamily)